MRLDTSRYYDAPGSSFSGIVPMDELLYEPFYQIMRLGLLGDKMVQEKEFGISESTVVVVCPLQNYDYRHTITSPLLIRRFPQAKSVEAIAKAMWNVPGRFIMTSPEELIAGVGKANLDEQVGNWLLYQHERYGW